MALPPSSSQEETAVSCTSRAVNLRRDSIGSGSGPPLRRGSPIRCASPVWLRLHRDALPIDAAVLGSSATMAQGPAHRARSSPARSRAGACRPNAPALVRRCERSLHARMPRPSGCGTRAAPRRETGSPAAWKDLEVERSPGRNGSLRPAMAGGDTRPDDGARPRSRRFQPSHPDERDTGDGAARGRAVAGRERQGGKGRGDAERLSAGIPSRGLILHRGKGAVRPALFGEEARPGNTMDPRIGSGMQQARDSRSGGSRRSGAKPQGRNGTSRVAPSEPKRRQAVGAGVDASGARRWRGGGTSGRARVAPCGWKPKREGHSDQGDRYGSGEERR